jgi:hypothetical protein
VTTLLRKNPAYERTWIGVIPPGTAPAAADEMIFMIAATWADEIKSDALYHDDGTEGGDRPPAGPSASQNRGYADHARHKYWHFVDTPFSTDGSALPAVPAPNAQTQIAAFRSALASTSSSDALKSYDLSWLLHLVGDVHQPLHCSTRASRKDGTGDNGGNKVRLSCARCSNLHAFWDGIPGPGTTTPASVIRMARTLPAPDATAAAKRDEKAWIAEGFQLAQGEVYASPPIGSGDGPFSVTTAYRNAARALARQRIALAGARLANLLNTELQ